MLLSSLPLTSLRKIKYLITEIPIFATNFWQILLIRLRNLPFIIICSLKPFLLEIFRFFLIGIQYHHNVIPAWELMHLLQARGSCLSVWDHSYLTILLEGCSCRSVIQHTPRTQEALECLRLHRLADWIKKKDPMIWRIQNSLSDAHFYPRIDKFSFLWHIVLSSGLLSRLQFNIIVVFGPSTDCGICFSHH